MPKEYDAIIIGAGPAGSTCAAFLGQKGHKVLLVDKEKFPRDKTCGDAISGSLKTQEALNLTPLVKKKTHAEVHRVVFSAPNGKVIDIPFNSVGYVCRRQIYDNLIFEKAKQHVDVLQEFTVTDLVMEGKYVRGIKGKTYKGVEVEIKGNVVVGADGAHSIVARKTGSINTDPKHTITAVRAYYKNVKNVTDAIELHFLNEIIPGYFWIFPVGDNSVNVGIGMVVDDFKKKDWKMTDKMFDVIQNSPLFKERFADAKLEEGTVKGWTLPVGSTRRNAHGNGYILLGDAAGLIDPFTGEGISNAMQSGQIAAKWIEEAINANNFSEGFLEQYEDNVWNVLGHKLEMSYKMQKLGRRKFLVNLVVNKVHKNQDIRDTLRTMLDSTEERKNLTSKMFYLKLLFS
ncbi:MAG: NAD(P)/FAD-dependent oxidoreductase [Nanoarchaeota archaeon]|nr:NAD(P)/FAD-dependent oxidoreductase [Nanoarchaeota archaeon]